MNNIHIKDTHPTHKIFPIIILNLRVINRLKKELAND